jgi:hypothetical protein
MTDSVLDAADVQQEPGGRRHPHGDDDLLILCQVDPASVIDDAEEHGLVELQSFGAMRETCPHCQDERLRLVLRQTHVRAPHLLCPRCNACFDAHFADGRSAFSL